MAKHPHNRAHRRVQRMRVISNRCDSIGWLKDYLESDSPYIDEKSKAVARGSIAKTVARCSCFSCGNARRHFGHTTLKEKRSLITFGETEE